MQGEISKEWLFCTEHVFWPRKLPQKQSKHIVFYEAYMLDLFHKFIDKSFNFEEQPSYLNVIKKLFRYWSHVQTAPIQAQNILKCIKSMKTSDVCPLLLRNQNAGFIMTMKDEGLLCTCFEVSFSAEQVTSAPGHLRCVFPGPATLIPKKQIDDPSFIKVFTKHLAALGNESFEDASVKVRKARSTTTEIRDTVSPKYVTSWLFGTLSGFNGPEETVTRITKTVRDEVLWDNALLPNRRSSMWIMIKITLHTTLVSILGKEEGTAAYKLLLIAFMTYLCEGYPLPQTDLPFQMIQKIASRMNKLRRTIDECSLSSSIIELRHGIFPKAVANIKRIRQTLEKQWKAVQHREKRFIEFNFGSVDFARDTTLSLMKAKDKIKHLLQPSTPTTRKGSMPESPVDKLCEFELQGFQKYTVDQCTDLLNDTKTYLQEARIKYTCNPEAFSLMMLTLFDAWMHLDSMLCEKYSILREHKTGVPIDVLQSTLLPYRYQMEKLLLIEKYVQRRDDCAKNSSLYGSFSSISDRTSFAARFAATSNHMQDIKREIITHAKKERENHRKQLKEARDEKAKQLQEAYRMTCNATRDDYMHYLCTKCSKEKRAKQMEFGIHEWPLPGDEFSYEDHEVDTVVFELQIPTDLASLRDLIHLIVVECDSGKKKETQKANNIISQYSKLVRWYQGNQKLVVLGSVPKPFMNSHYQKCSLSEADASFFKPNGCVYFLCDASTKTRLSTPVSCITEKCTLQIPDNSAYRKLQWVVDGTSHNENQVLAQQVECPKEVELAEYIQFGTLRAGNRLQWRNILAVLEGRLISLSAEASLVLLLQTVWQAGSREEDEWCRESHEEINKNHDLTMRLITVLQETIERFEDNWSERNVMIIVVTLSTRILSLSDSRNVKQRAAKLILNCRSIVERWVQSMLSVLAGYGESEVSHIAKMRTELALTAACGILTCSADAQDLSLILSTTRQTTTTWLNLMVRYHDDLSLSRISVNALSTLEKNILWRVNRIAFNMKSYLKRKLTEDSSILNEFIRSIWPDAVDGEFGHWYPYSTSAFMTSFSKDSISESNLYIDIVTGKFLIDGIPIARLPQLIIENSDYQRTFGPKMIFEVQPGSRPGSFISVHRYHGATLLFSLDSEQQLTISERNETLSERVLIPHNYLSDDLPRLFVSEYTHWFNKNTRRIEFQPLNQSLFETPDIKFSWSLETELLTEQNSARNLVDIHSKSFSMIVYNVLERLENRMYIHIFSSSKSQVVVELPRMGLQFQVDFENNQLASREHSGLIVAKDQSMETLIGLENYILLTDKWHTEKKILVPHGNVQRESDVLHHRVHISTGLLSSPPVFVYEVDEDLQQLKADSNFDASLMLAYLHASTSSYLSDPLTGKTGAERAIELLQSPLCVSIHPLQSSTLGILDNIATLSPKRSYYPPKMEKMQQINWPSNQHTVTSNDAFYLLAEVIRTESSQLVPLFTGNGSAQTKLENTTDDTLLRKGYWRNRYADPNKLFYRLDSKLQGRPAHATYSPRHYDPSINDISSLAQSVHREIFSVVDANINFDNLVKQSTKIKSVSIGTEVEHWGALHPISNWVSIYDLIVRGHWSTQELLFLLTFLQFKYPELKTCIQSLAAIAIRRGSFKLIDDSNYDFSYGYELSETGVYNMLYNNINRLNHMIYSWEARNQHFTEAEERCRTITKFILKRGAHERSSYSPSQWFDSISYIDIPTTSINALVSGCFLKTAIDDISRRISNLNLFGYVAQFSYHTYEPLLARNVENDHIISKDLSDEKMPQLYIIFDEEDDIPLTNEHNDTDKHLQPLNIFRRTSTCAIEESYRKDLAESFESFCQNDENDWEKIRIPHNINKILNKNIDMIHEKISKVEKEIRESWFAVDTEYCDQALQLADLWPKFSRNAVLKQLNPSLPDAGLLVHKDAINLRNCISALGVLITRKHRLERCLKFSFIDDRTNLKKELLNKGHSNWNPLDYPEWLLLELENKFMIREIQAKVALPMMNPSEDKNMVLQLNMGEGKSSVIVPLLASALANEKVVVRVVVLKPLLSVAHELLRTKLGGILERTVYLLPFHRDIKIEPNLLSAIEKVYLRCKREHGIVITVPEYILSFQLMSLEGARANIPIAPQLLKIQRWLDRNTRDILDESDEILHVKYQLVYTIGAQVPLAAGEMRWVIVQNVLNLIKQHALDIYTTFKDDIEYREPPNPGSYPHFRFISDNIEPYQVLCTRIMTDVLNRKTKDIRIPELPSSYHAIVIKFTTVEEMSTCDLESISSILLTNSELSETLLMLRGLLACKVVFFSLSKRWRVNYGVMYQGRRRMAVPFRAKDLASERTEFGHPDVAILLTQLSYYYSGLSLIQLEQTFDILYKSPTPQQEYRRWVELLKPDEHEAITPILELDGVNLSDRAQMKNLLYPLFKKNVRVVDFWLSHAVFSAESKQFESKMVASGWDLAKQKRYPTTGFSGTNDTRILLPLSIEQKDLNELKKTNAMVVKYLIDSRKNMTSGYQRLEPNVTGKDLLKIISERILLDVGALMMELSNEAAAVEWLSISPSDVEAAVYFNKHDQIEVCDRFMKKEPLASSPYRHRLGACVIYLDDAHCRGTDLKFPTNACAAVTLGKGVTKDKFVQACMRMRLLGHGQSVNFYASYEVHKQIKKNSMKDKIETEDVIRWTFENSRKATEDGFMMFGIQGISFYRRSDTLENSGSFSETVLGDRCTEQDSTTLVELYGRERYLETMPNIILKQSANILANKDLVDAKQFKKNTYKIVSHCDKYVGKLERFANLLDEEQERELETEKEDERQVERPPQLEPKAPRLSISIDSLRFRHKRGIIEPFNDPGVVHISHDLLDTSIVSMFQSESWSKHLYCTKDFTRVVKLSRKNHKDEFLRPVRYLVLSQNNYILLSAYEANEYLPYFRKRLIPGELLMFVPRTRQNQRTLMESSVVLPPTKTLTYNNKALAELSVFANSLYYNSNKEQDEVCEFIGLCLARVGEKRTPEQQQAFDQGMITLSGFVPPDKRRILATTCQFKEDPVPMLRTYIQLRNRSEDIVVSHLGSILSRALKQNVEEDE